MAATYSAMSVFEARWRRLWGAAWKKAKLVGRALALPQTMLNERFACQPGKTWSVPDLLHEQRLGADRRLAVFDRALDAVGLPGACHRRAGEVKQLLRL